MGVCASKNAVELSEAKSKPVLKIPLSSALQKPSVLSTPLVITNAQEPPLPEPDKEVWAKKVEVQYEYGYEYGEEEYEYEVEVPIDYQE
jgi:hypothetical protein